MSDERIAPEATSIQPEPAAEPVDSARRSPDAEATPLDRVVDDLEANQLWSQWAIDELTAGRTAEAVAEELIANGWSEDDATVIAEAARRQTRHLRGVITRDEVARENASRYHKGTALSWFTAFLSISSAWRLLNSVTFLLGSRRQRHTADHTKDGPPSGGP